MNKIFKILTTMVFALTAIAGNAQAQPTKLDTALDRLKKAMSEYDSLVKDINERHGNAPSSAELKRGDKKDGGIVYWTEAGGKHGLIVWPGDMGILKWDEAVAACAKLGTGWRMPTKDELDKLYRANLELKLLESFFFFRSSTEPEKGYIWLQSFKSGEVKKGYKSGTASTAAVKSF